MAERDMDDFERGFAARLVDYAAIPVAPVAAGDVAHAVVAPRPRRAGVLPFPIGVPTAAWVVIALALAIAGGLLAGALLQQVRPLGTMPMVLALEDGLYLAAERGEGRRLLRDDGSFIGPRWSPGGDRIAVLHGPPIPPQTGASGGQPHTPATFDLVPAELLVLDGAGSTRFAVPGPIRDFAWAPPGADGISLLAIGSADGRVSVVGDDGAIVAALQRDPPVAETSVETPLMPPGLSWASPHELLVASGGDVLALDVTADTGPRVVLASGASHVNAIAASPDGLALAAVVASCAARCDGEVRVARIGSSDAGATPAQAPAGRSMGATVRASTAVSWSPDGDSVLAWPLVAPRGDRATSRLPAATALESRDVVTAWTRYAPDGSGQVIALNVYPYYNDRHFDAWLVAADGTASRIAVRSLGFDIRPVRE